MEKKYRGIVVPVITPLKADLHLDTASVEKLMDSFRAVGAHTFILGTTGEFPSLPAALKVEYIRLAARLKKGRALYVGISGNCLSDSVELARIAFGEGADVVVANLPAYYQLTEEQIRRYYELLVEGVGGPLMIYNIPSTTHHSIPLELIDGLSQHPDIVGIKDSERNEERLRASLRLWSDRADFSHFLGWSAKSAESLLNGGDGLVPSTANLDPGVYSAMEKAALKGDKDELERLQAESDRLGATYQSGKTQGSSLAMLKALMHRQGLCQPYMMPPL
jgi:dihydrodipicolinate synthase/N-acetylneuraminate lyase